MSKNTSSKGKPKPGGKPSVTARSRNTTPLPNVRTSVEPSAAAASASYFSKPLTALARRCDVSVEDILDRGGSSSQQVPSGAALISMREALETKVLANVQKRCDVSNAALRELQSLKKNSRDKDRTPKKDAADDHRLKVKKQQAKRALGDDRPPTTGAHGVARQDGVGLLKGLSTRNLFVHLSLLLPLPSFPPSLLVLYTASRSRV